MTKKKFPQVCPKCGGKLDLEHDMTFSSLIYCTECGYEVGYVDNNPKEIEKMMYEDNK